MIMAASKKRQLLTPSGCTPSYKKRLESSFSEPMKWSQGEDSKLVEYLLQKNFSSCWPTTKHTGFWEEAAQFLNENCGTKRTSK